MTKYFLLILTVIFARPVFSQNSNILRQEILQIIATKHATVGIFIKSIEDKDTLSINGNLKMPLMSVFKFHIALTVLNEVDKGKFSLKQKIYIKKEDLHENTWSPIRDEYPNGNRFFTLD